jgi:hypothetical protein
MLSVPKHKIGGAGTRLCLCLPRDERSELYGVRFQTVAHLLCRNVSDVCGDGFMRVDPEEQSKWCQLVPPEDIRQ